MQHGIDHNASFCQCFCNRGTDQLLDFTGVIAPAASVQRLRQLADRLCKRSLRFCKLRFRPGKDNVIRIETAYVNSEVVRLCEEHVIRQATWNCLMSMARYERCDIRELGS